jgi:hypothetical protein
LNSSKSTNNRIDKNAPGLTNTIDKSKDSKNYQEWSISETNRDFYGKQDSNNVDPNALICWSCLTSLESEVCQGFGANNPFIHVHPLLG